MQVRRRQGTVALTGRKDVRYVVLCRLDDFDASATCFQSSLGSKNTSLLYVYRLASFQLYSRSRRDQIPSHGSVYPCHASACLLECYATCTLCNCGIRYSSFYYSSIMHGSWWTRRIKRTAHQSPWHACMRHMTQDYCASRFPRFSARILFPTAVCLLFVWLRH